MWLLNTHTYKLEYFIGETIPRYAILSHTWGAEEVSFQDLRERPDAAAKLSGYRKIEYTCQQAQRDGLKYAWVDTCCIDKSSSAELSESINSMYGFYERSAVCFVYLSDVRGHGLVLTDPDDDEYGETENEDSEPETARQVLFESFRKCRWFTRGWCLQELIASRAVHFYDEQWKLLGNKQQLTQTLSRITGIDTAVLYKHRNMSQICIARKMSWAANRSTTRTEDRAYSLMGLFNVNMPLLYGEGGKNAFRRLQQEIIRTSTDQSIFAWAYHDNIPERHVFSYLLAPSPYYFRNAATIISLGNGHGHTSFTLTNGGLHVQIPLLSCADGTFAVLNCRYEDNLTGPICLRLEEPSSAELQRDVPNGDSESQSSQGESPRLYQICPERRRLKNHKGRYNRLVVKSLDIALSAPVTNLTVALHDNMTRDWRPFTDRPTIIFQLVLNEFLQQHFDIVHVWPRERWNPETLIMRSLWKGGKIFWAYLTLREKRLLSVKFSVVFSCSVNSDAERRECKLQLYMHDMESPSADLLKQRVAAAGLERTSCASFHLMGESFDVLAQSSDPKIVMGSEVREIKISALKAATAQDGAAQVHGTRAKKLSKSSVLGSLSSSPRGWDPSKLRRRTPTASPISSG